MPSTLQFTIKPIPAAPRCPRQHTHACRAGAFLWHDAAREEWVVWGYVSEMKILAPRSAVQMKNGVKPSSVRMPLSRRRPVSRCCCLPRCRCRCSDARTQIPKGDGALCLVHSRAVRICTSQSDMSWSTQPPGLFWGVGPSPKITADLQVWMPAPARR